MSQRYLVVGMNGTIGSALLTRLKENGMTAWGTTQRPADAEQANVFYLNLLDKPSSWQFPAIKFDVVYLCAGICRMNLCENDPTGTAKVNIDGMQALAKHFAERGAFVVYLSTNQVFWGDTPFVTEEAPYQPLNEYGRQKALVETWIKTHCPRWAIVRLTKVVEPRMQLIQQWIDSLTNNQTIEAFHDMVLAPVSLRQVIDVLLAIGEKQQNGCYQVSGARDVTYEEAARYVAAQLRCSTDLIKSISALDKGIKKTFLPRFTSLVCSSTIALCGQQPPDFSEVVQECFSIV